MAKKPRRGATRRAPLSAERILRCAIGLADDSGIESLSMRNLADQLGVEAMSLYNHISNKDDILEGMTDLVVAEIELPSGDVDWKAGMRQRAISAHHVLLRHPWAAALLESRPGVSPTRLRYADSVLGVLRRAGFSVELAYEAFLTLDSYIYGFTLQAASWAYEAKEAPAVVERLMTQVPMSEYPHLVEVMGFVRGPRAGRASAASYQSEFEFGLDLILDGLERVRDAGDATAAKS